MLDNYQDIKKITFSEYLDIVDPDRIKHSSSAYNYDTEKLNQFFTQLLNHIFNHIIKVIFWFKPPLSFSTTTINTFRP